MAKHFWYTINSAQEVEWQEGRYERAFETMLHTMFAEFITLNPTMESDGVNITGMLFQSSDCDSKERNDIQCVAVLENVESFMLGAKVTYVVWNPAKRLSSVVIRQFD